jgi:hypothetical protein
MSRPASPIDAECRAVGFDLLFEGVGNLTLTRRTPSGDQKLAQVLQMQDIRCLNNHALLLARTVTPTNTTPAENDRTRAYLISTEGVVQNLPSPAPWLIPNSLIVRGDVVHVSFQGVSSLIGRAKKDKTLRLEFALPRQCKNIEARVIDSGVVQIGGINIAGLRALTCASDGTVGILASQVDTKEQRLSLPDNADFPTRLFRVHHDDVGPLQDFEGASYDSLEVFPIGGQENGFRVFSSTANQPPRGYSLAGEMVFPKTLDWSAQFPEYQADWVDVDALNIRDAKGNAVAKVSGIRDLSYREGALLVLARTVSPSEGGSRHLQTRRFSTTVEGFSDPSTLKAVLFQGGELRLVLNSPAKNGFLQVESNKEGFNLWVDNSRDYRVFITPDGEVESRDYEPNSKQPKALSDWMPRNLP